MDTTFDASATSQRHRPAAVRWLAGVLAVAVVLAGIGYAVKSRGENDGATVPAAVARAADGAVIIPNLPENGVLEITIPPGTAESMAAGGRGYALPSRIDLVKGDKIVIHNNDTYPHLMMFAFVLPGQTTERTFTTVGSETYSAGCSIDPTPNGFTSLFVSE